MTARLGQAGLDWIGLPLISDLVASLEQAKRETIAAKLFTAGFAGWGGGVASK